METKVKKATNAVRRPKFADEKYLGSEPTVNVETTDCQMSNVYSWFNYFYSSEDALSFTIAYLKSIKHDKETIRKLSSIKSHSFSNWVGWNCRLLSQGSTLPEGLWEKTVNQIEAFARSVVSDVGGDSGESPAFAPKVISIQERVNAKSSELIGELEEHMDVFFKEGVVQFDVKKWSIDKAIKPQIAKRIADHFRPHYTEIADAVLGKDAELVEAYRNWRKPVLKIMAVFVKRIVDHMTELESAAVAVRKPRKKKIVPVSKQVEKMKYQEESKEFNLTSVNPCSIVGASQLWVFNTKTRTLSVYNAVGTSGLAVKGTSLLGYDETSSVSKKIRKPLEILHRLLNESKVGLRKIMSLVKTKESAANGRINADTVLVKVVK